jgi:hypothetical protein
MGSMLTSIYQCSINLLCGGELCQGETERDRPVGVAQEPEEVAVEGAASAEEEEARAGWGGRKPAQVLAETVFAPTAAPRLLTR